MTSQFSLWLYPVLALSVVSLVFRLQLPWQWSWGFILQVIPLAALAIAGLTVGPDWLYAIIAWSFIIVFYFGPKYFYSDLQRSLTRLDAARLRRNGNWIVFIFWGMSGQFWRDMSDMLAFYIERKPAEALAIQERWKDRKGLPKQLLNVTDSYRLIGRGVLWEWEDIISQYESAQSSAETVPSNLLLAAARAYAETNQFEKAAHCMIDAKLPESNLPLTNLCLTMIPFFALTGSQEETNQLDAILSEHRPDFVESSSLYWQGRCKWAAGDAQQAKELLAKAGQSSQSDLFKHRIETVIARIDAGIASGADPLIEAARDMRNERGQLISSIWGVFQKAAFVQEIIAPRRKSMAVNILIAVIVFGYILTDGLSMPFFFGQFATFAKWFHDSIFLKFALIPSLAVKGEYWRFITYLFLHAHFTHALFNLLGLYWFGRVAENIFGTSRFIAIFLVGGLLSGVAHALLSPDLTAVGASGGVMAMFGAVAAGIFRLKDKIPRSIWQMELSWLGGMMLAQLFLDQIIPHVAVFAHLGGLVAGLAIGMILSIRTAAKDEVDGTQRFVAG